MKFLESLWTAMWVCIVAAALVAMGALIVVYMAGGPSP